MLVEIIKLIVEVIAVAVVSCFVTSYLVTYILNHLHLHAEFSVQICNIMDGLTMKQTFPVKPCKGDKINLPLDEIRTTVDKGSTCWEVVNTLFTTNDEGEVVYRVMVKSTTILGAKEDGTV